MRFKLALPQVVELFMQAHDLQLGLEVDLVVVGGVGPVARGLEGGYGIRPSMN